MSCPAGPRLVPREDTVGGQEADADDGVAFFEEDASGDDASGAIS